jgi:hypothetical protein
VKGHRRVGIERGGYAITPSGSSGKNSWCCFSDLGAGLRGQRRNEMDVNDMKQIKAHVIVSVLGSAATVITLASVVGAGKKWAN